jgi:hypothetical protein
VDSSGSGPGSVAVSCVHVNEVSGSWKAGNVLAMTEAEFFGKGHVAWSCPFPSPRQLVLGCHKPSKKAALRFGP